MSELLSMARHVWTHKNNRGRRGRAFAKAICWQLKKRLFGAPTFIRINDAVTFKVVPDSKYGSLVVYTGLPDYDELKFLSRVLRAGDAFVDIGSNVGFYTLFASTLVADGPILAIEPNPANVKVLREQICLNSLSSVTVVPEALSDSTGVVKFSAPLRETGRINLKSDGTESHFAVPCRKLDDLLTPEMSQRRVIAKMDIEGGECLALRGAATTLSSKSIPIWVFELSQHNLRSLGSSVDELLSHFVNAGYEILYWDEETARLGCRGDHLDSGRSNYIASCDSEFLYSRLGSATTSTATRFHQGATSLAANAQPNP